MTILSQVTFRVSHFCISFSVLSGQCMTCSVEAYRVSVGCFSPVLCKILYMKAKKARERPRQLRCTTTAMKFTLLCIITALLLRAGVEPNPGPTRQTKLGSSSNSNQSFSSGEDAKQESIADVIKALKDLSTQVGKMDCKIDALNEKMQQQLDSVMKENKELKEKVQQLEDKMDDMEGRSRRNNLLFHGIPTPSGRTETWTDCEEAVKKVIKDKMGIDEDVEIERAHRLRGGRSPQPIIAFFSRFKQKEKVLWERRKLKDTGVAVSEDFTLRVREKRRQLLPFLKDAKRDNKRAFLRHDFLVIEGKSFAYNPEAKRLEERHGAR